MNSLKVKTPHFSPDENGNCYSAARRAQIRNALQSLFDSGNYDVSVDDVMDECECLAQQELVFRHANDEKRFRRAVRMFLNVNK